MKKSILMLASAGLMIAAPSCKKGENDPGLSLSSRKARISNNWTVSAISSTYTETDGDGDSWSNTRTFDGTTNTLVSSNTSGGTTVSNTSTSTFTDYSVVINKDGTYTMTQAYTYSDDDSFGGFTTTTAHTVTITSSGSWSFVGKEKDSYKNKERVILNSLSFSYTDDVVSTTVDDSDGSTVGTPTTSSTTNSDVESHGQDIMIFDIDMLKGKEMTWMQTFDGSDSNSSTTGSTTISSSSTITGSETWTLVEQG
ncbi:MAG: hypothetical protein MK078_11445 [Crocinitomicaceae bacterium]|nr:hypothetical protein [Crocinitomicaceae bacterium]